MGANMSPGQMLAVVFFFLILCLIIWFGKENGWFRESFIVFGWMLEAL